MILLGTACAQPADSSAPIDTQESQLLFANARVVASGIPGAGAIAQVHPFHRGSPVHDNPTFALSTQPGAVLDPTRLLVASSSNFGAPLHRPNEAPGSVLSLDVSGTSVLAVPADFAAAGGQASAVGGLVRVYVAQNGAFRNGINNPGALTADLPSVSLPLGISINNAFGRPWFANAPSGAHGDGTLSVVDPSGIGLAGAPDPVAGGVFAGDLTNRGASTTHGITHGALATSLFTRSPDGSGRAVFFVAVNDGSVEQVHVQRGVDGLVAPLSFTPLPVLDVGAVESADPRIVTRVGMVFNWVPNLALFVSDPLANRIMVVDITNDGTLLTASAPRYLSSPLFDKPIDLAASSPEVASANFSSPTMAGGGADLFVLNRGNNTIVRVRQDGTFVAMRPVIPDQSIPGFRVAGLAVSTDGRHIYVTGTAPGRKGYVLKMASFGANFVTGSMVAAAAAAGAVGVEAMGGDMFSRAVGPLQLVGPLFNGQSCADCHNLGFAGGDSPRAHDESRVGRLVGGVFDPLALRGGPVTRGHSISELGFSCSLPTGVPPLATIVSPRRAMTLRGNGFMDNIQDRTLIALQASQPEAIRGRINFTPDGRVGKFGWKAGVPSLVEFMGDAFRTEMGLTNPLRPDDLVHGCGADILDQELDALPLMAVTAFMNTLNPPVPSAACLASAGATSFASLGCAGCHTPSIASEGTQARLYADLLLHDMGPGLADGVPDNLATGSEFRTMPLWRVSERARFLHNGRASSIDEAIRLHGGQAQPAADAYQALSPADQQAVLDFLGCI